MEEEARMSSVTMRSDSDRVELVSGGSRNRSGASNLKVLIENWCLASLPINDVVSDHCVASRRFSSYQKLPQPQNLKLSVLKLDGSAFEVNILKNATIAELKMAIEEVFGSSPKEGQDKISWSLVWGHFCLCYEGQKLVNDKVQIGNYGIKEGDQLQFIRHMTINYSPCKSRPKMKTIACKRNLRLLPPSGSRASEKVEKTDEIEQEDKYNSRRNEDQEESHVPQFKMAHFWRGLISYSKSWGASKVGSSSNCHTMKPTRFALQFSRA